MSEIIKMQTGFSVARTEAEASSADVFIKTEVKGRQFALNMDKKINTGLSARKIENGKGIVDVTK